jgi:iron complex transport system substrate-binding protein
MRIASLQPSITVALHALGRLDSLCAHTKYCLEVLPELAARNLPILHDSWTADTTEILAANPNLVIASVPYRMESLAAILKSSIPVLALAPKDVATTLNDIRLIASVVDAQDEGERLIAQVRQTIAHTASLTAYLPRPTVYCEEWGNPLIHSQTWVAELVQAAGGAFLGTPGAHTDAAAIAAANPEVLIFAWCGAGDRVPLARVIEKRGWQHLKAVREGRVYCIPDEYLNTPAHTLLEGLAHLGAAIHPEALPAAARLIHLSK